MFDAAETTDAVNRLPKSDALDLVKEITLELVNDEREAAQ